MYAIRSYYVAYKRILLKLSGESLMGEQEYGIDQTMLNDYAEQINVITSYSIHYTKLYETMFFADQAAYLPM